MESLPVFKIDISVKCYKNVNNFSSKFNIKDIVCFKWSKGQGVSRINYLLSADRGQHNDMSLIYIPFLRIRFAKISEVMNGYQLKIVIITFIKQSTF